MSPIRRLVAIGVALLVVIGVAVVAINLAGGSATGSADASSTAAPSGRESASASPTIEPSASVPDDDVLATLREIEEQVIEIRGLPAADIGQPDLITRAELGGELQRIFDEEYPPEDRERDTIVLRALGLLEEGQDVVELQLQLLGDQVLGFYDDVDRRMVIVSDAGLDAEARMTYAHEYTHALQDAAFDFDALEAAAGDDDDQALAHTALIEGDASVTMLVWAFAHLTSEELLEISGGTQLPDTTGIPTWMVRQLEFPYTDGLSWASVLVGNPLEPDYTAIDEAFADPPTSTEQILDIRKWDPREDPLPVDGLDLAAALGDDWEEVDVTPIGQAFLSIMLEFHGVDRTSASEAGDGWGGDQMVVASGPDDAFAVAWRLAWDTPTDAAEFAAAYRGILGTLDFPATVVELGDDEVLVVHASTDDLVRRTQDAADG